MKPGVHGLPQAQRRFREFPPAVAVEVEKALEIGAQEIKARAQMIVPVDSGDLRGAIEVRRTLEGFTGTGAIGNFARMVSGAAGTLRRFIGVFPARAGSPGWYAAWVEFGTAAGTRRIKKGPAAGATFDHPGTPARPFLLPAFLSLRRRTVGRINRAINKAAREVARRG